FSFQSPSSLATSNSSSWPSRPLPLTSTSAVADSPFTSTFETSTDSATLAPDSVASSHSFSALPPGYSNSLKASVWNSEQIFGSSLVADSSIAVSTADSSPPEESELPPQADSANAATSSARGRTSNFFFTDSVRGAGADRASRLGLSGFIRSAPRRLESF